MEQRRAKRVISYSELSGLDSRPDDMKPEIYTVLRGRSKQMQISTLKWAMTISCPIFTITLIATTLGRLGS